MTKRTRVTSTSGVTLIAVSSSSSLLSWPAMVRAPLKNGSGEREKNSDAHAAELRKQLAGQCVGTAEPPLDHALKGVERGDCRDGDQDADGGRDQCLAHFRHQARADAASTRVERGERAHDADHGTEQAHERRV